MENFSEKNIKEILFDTKISNNPKIIYLTIYECEDNNKYASCPINFQDDSFTIRDLMDKNHFINIIINNMKNIKCIFIRSGENSSTTETYLLHL